VCFEPSSGRREALAAEGRRREEPAVFQSNTRHKTTALPFVHAGSFRHFLAKMPPPSRREAYDGFRLPQNDLIIDSSSGRVRYCNYVIKLEFI